ncbi:MAG TPA: hypothetical protein VMA37_10030 [Acetobacteraceae bacterium]|nr:hypothetical protein [Acetobacteraceae bacterium]
MLAALLAASPLDVSVSPTEAMWRFATLWDRAGPYAAESGPAFTSPGTMQAASPTKTAAATEPGAPPTSNGGIHRQNEDLVAQRERLQAQLRALAAQIAEQTARFKELHAQTGEAAQELAAMPEIRAHIAQETGTLSALQAELKQARQKLASLRVRVRTPRTATAQTSPGQTSPGRTSLAMSAPAPQTRFDAVRSLERQWRREGAQLIAARSALSAGDSTHAKQWIEAVQTQLVFQPVTPDDPIPGPGSNIAARLLAQAISLLNVGATSSAIAVLDRAIAYLGATPDPAPGVAAASPG